jgi:hypothetical protein
MTTKSLLITGALGLSLAAGIADAKSYVITLSGPTSIGANQFKAGEYEVKVQGSQMVVTDEDRGKSVSVPATIEHSDRKFADTSVESTDKDGRTTITAITLGGSDTRVVVDSGTPTQ